MEANLTAIRKLAASRLGCARLVVTKRVTAANITFFAVTLMITTARTVFTTMFPFALQGKGLTAAVATVAAFAFTFGAGLGVVCVTRQYREEA